jgi:branched-chain amino acid transport system permease protein
MLQYGLANLASGAAYGLIGLCVVLIYRLLGVLNFAQGVIGTIGAFVAISAFGAGMPYVLAAGLGALAGAGVAALIGLLMATWFAEADLQTRSSVTIALMISLLVLGFRLFGNTPRTVPQFLPGLSLQVGPLVIPAATLALVAAMFALAGLLSVLLKRTRIGLQLQALAERPISAELLAIPARPLTVAVWAVAGAIASLTILVIAPTRSSDLLTLSLLVLPALGAALLGLFRSFWLAISGGLGIGLLEGLANSLPSIAPYRQVLPLLIILAALLWWQRREVWDAAR